jgi:hypothetical protein
MGIIIMGSINHVGQMGGVRGELHSHTLLDLDTIGGSLFVNTPPSLHPQLLQPWSVLVSLSSAAVDVALAAAGDVVVVSDGVHRCA